MIEVDYPKHYGSRIRNEIMAGPGAVRYRDYSIYYFDVGLKLSYIKKDTDLLKILKNAITGDRFNALTIRSLIK